MPSAFRDPKSLAEWIQLDYFRRPRGLRRWRSWLSWGTFAAFAAVVLFIMLLPRGKGAFQAGPVSGAHAPFNNDCGQCHVDAFQTARRIWTINADKIHAVPNDACEKCHDGPPHNANQIAEPNCAHCHVEHRGRPTLARVSDDYCTACHADLKPNSKAGADTAFLDVASFPKTHPDFQIWRSNRTDPGQLRFNHKVHLKPEGILAPGGKTEHLDCETCHRADSAGRLMQPINYTTHCARCHPLSVQLSGPFADKQSEGAAAAFAKEPAPHKEPAVVRAVLRDRLIQFLQANPVQAKPLPPGRFIPRPRRLEAVTELQWSTAKQLLTEAERLLFTNQQLPHNEEQLFDRPAGCVYCHVPAKADGVARQTADGLPVYEPTQLTARWLTHARFGHDSHRMLACTECHPATDSTATADVLLPHVETCARCHNARVGVRSDCIECHAYHHRDPGAEKNKGHTIAEALGE